MRLQQKNMKPALLYLCHRIPYPPNKGDKIRSFHLLKHLSKSHRVFLGAFIDDPADLDHVSELNKLCEETFFVELDPKRARIKSLTGLLTGKPLTLPYYYSRKLENWVRKTASKHSIDKLIAYSSAMAQYAMQSDHPFNFRVIDFVDIDSDKWRQYSQNKSWPMSLVYRREADQLLAYEKAVAREFDASFFVSQSEADMFKELVPEIKQKVNYYNNGVDTVYFDPKKINDNPYPQAVKTIVFTGAMDYWPNIDAVIWFSESVLPELNRLDSKIRFYIVGSNPSEAVERLGNNPNIEVTGRVEDIRPYIKFSVACVAPVRIARGIQNKVLEAMAMERPVVTSPQGYEGIIADTAKELIVAEEADDWVQAISQIVSVQDFSVMGKAARMRVVQDYSWQGSLALIEQKLCSRMMGQ